MSMPSAASIEPYGLGPVKANAARTRLAFRRVVSVVLVLLALGSAGLAVAADKHSSGRVDGVRRSTSAGLESTPPSSQSILSQHRRLAEGDGAPARTSARSAHPYHAEMVARAEPTIARTERTPK